MLYYLEDGSDAQPTLEEMTRAAIQVLSKEKNGFYLFVEGGRIDQAHHQNYARRALAETVEFHKAVQVRAKYFILTIAINLEVPLNQPRKGATSNKIRFFIPVPEKQFILQDLFVC